MNSKSEAELEKFLERKIIEFLDLKKSMKNTNNEMQDFEELIKQNKITEASKILEDAIEKFNRLNPNDVYREINFNKIIEMVRIVSKLTKNNEKNRLTEDVYMLIKSKQLEQDPTLNITVFDERKEQERKEQEIIQEKQRQMAGEIENQMMEINKKLFVSIRKKDLKNAIMQYRELKKKFEEYPPMLVESKAELYNDLLAFYMRIKNLKEEIKNLPKNTKHEIEKPVIKENHLKLEEIQEIVNQIQKDTKEEKFTEAKTKILELKHKISLIPENYINIKKKLEYIATSLIKKIEFAKRMQNQINTKKRLTIET
ncbi:hypothetical protein KO361_01865 [Candidatus Woesearchaeota archaeon]|nr:hypothetical protein [Candidatus Woesearchaeota archaeon]